MAQLIKNPVVGSFDRSHMKKVHRRIFQDVYAWAGQTRAGPLSPPTMTKSWPDVSGGPGVPVGVEKVYRYYPSDHIHDDIEKQYRLLADKGLLVGMDFDDFVTEFAERWAEINTGGSALFGEELSGVLCDAGLVQVSV